MSQQHTKTLTMEVPAGVLDEANSRPFVLTAYAIVDATDWTLEPAPVARDWMEIDKGFAYRCLPMTVANAAGWAVGCPVSFVATWSGAPTKGAIRFDCDEPIHRHMRSITDHFGNGIVTFNLPWQFGTNRPGIGLRVSGLPNACKFNATALEGFVETDWLPFTFTMNWKLQRPNIPVQFTKGEPICFLQPMSLDFVEAAIPQLANIADNPPRKEAFDKWESMRRTFNADPCRKPEDWQKFYHKAADAAPGKHRTSIKPQPFVRAEPTAEGA